MGDNDESLKSRIRKEMMTDYSDALDKNFELAKSFLKISDRGNIEVLRKDDVTNEDKVLLYLIGKLYSEVGELSETAFASIEELENELGLLGNTLRPILKGLFDGRIIEKEKKGKSAFYRMRRNHVERVLKGID